MVDCKQAVWQTVSDTAQVEMHVLGLIGKILTEPWMKAFYTSSVNQIDHLSGITVIQNVLKNLKEQQDFPLGMLTCYTDFWQCNRTNCS